MTADATSPLEQLTINTLRTLAIDAVQHANSGHPGAPMGLAPLAYHLFQEVMRYNPANPGWANRDRFVLSAGHASMLQYAALHLYGYAVSLDDIKAFRQLHSITPGHPEVHHTPGIETTTGPLGQGISTAVGMALGEAMWGQSLASEDGGRLVDHFTYVIASDGDLMEGVSHEAASLAGHLKLGKLIAYYDDNSITIDGRTDLAWSEDVAARFEAYGWHVLRVADINDLDALRHATRLAQAKQDQPSLVIVKSRIGYGSPNKEDSSSAHGSPLGEDEVRLTKERLGWPSQTPFFIPDTVLAHTRQAVAKGATLQAAWEADAERWRAAHPDRAAELDRRLSGDLPEGWVDQLPSFDASTGKLATRKASAAVLKALMHALPELVGGSADLAGSNGTKHFGTFGAVAPGDFASQLIHFGIREHGMAAVCSGLSLYGTFRPFCATFLVFTDYLRPALRLAGLMHQPVVYIMTHDSIGLGEDGPTHQPVEHLAACRSIPNVHVLRPCDARETLQAWIYAIQRTTGPTVLALTRQGVPSLDRLPDGGPHATAAHLHRGGYTLLDPADGSAPQLALIATGSEVALALQVQRTLADDHNIPARVVSMPCIEAFFEQPASWRDEVLPPTLRARLAIEAAHSMSWHRIVGLDGDIAAIDSFGASAPCADVMAHFGFTAEALTARALALHAQHQG